MTPLQAGEDEGHENGQRFLNVLRAEMHDEWQIDTQQADGMTPLQASEYAGHQDVQQCLVQLRTEVHDELYDDSEKSFRSDRNCREIVRGSGMSKVSACDRWSGINGESYYQMPLNVTAASILMQNPRRTNRERPSRHIKTTTRPTRVSCVSKPKTQLHGGEVPATNNLTITSENDAVEPNQGIKRKRRNIDNGFSIPTLCWHYWAILALVFFSACRQILVAGTLTWPEPVTLEAGTRGVVTFYLERPSSTLQFSLFYKIQFGSKGRPFCINGQYDVDGFKDPSQESRYTTTVLDRDTSPCVNVTINDVDIVDEDQYILTEVWRSSENTMFHIQKTDVVVQRHPGPADCFITLSDSEYPYEVHCWAKTGSMPTTLTCFQNNWDLVKVHNITDNGHTTRALFFLPDTTHFSCCSHDITSTIDAATCNDFEWPPGYSGIHSTKKTISRSRSASAQPNRPTDPRLNTDTVGSGPCRPYIIPSQWHFLYLFIYLFAFVIMC